MSAMQRIVDFLRKNMNEPYCDDCLSIGLGVVPRQQVQKKTSELGKQASFRRIRGNCSRCHEGKIVVHAVSSNSQGSSVQSKAEELCASAVGMTVISKHSNTALTPSEETHCKIIGAKDFKLREFLDRSKLNVPPDALQWLSYLTGIKHILGNINNDASFLATLLIKQYLQDRFSITNFDAGEKAQGAPGIDIRATTHEGEVVEGELKTTKPYQRGFGAAQRTSILKDLSRLAASKAKHRFMFVIDASAFRDLAHKSFAACAPGVEVVNLVTGENFVWAVH